MCGTAGSGRSPAEEGAQPQDEIAEDIVEVPPPAHEEVRMP